MGNSSCQSCGEADCENAASSGPSSLPVESQKVLSSPPSINTWDFSSLSYDSTVLQGVAHELMTPAYGKSGGTQVELLRGFLRAVASGYQQNPFHNFAHAIDVLQALCWQSTQISGEHFLSSIQQFALTIAAIAVDLGHPGVDNAFLIDTGDPIASCYNDFSPLENMHCSQLFELLKKEALNVLGHLPAEDFREARRLIIDAILHTDRYRHLEVLNEVRAIARQGYTPKGAEHSSPEGLDILQALSRALLVFADVAHQARPLQTSNVWAKALEDELALQNERERDLGLQVLPLNKWKPSRSDLQLHLAINRSGPLLGALLHIFPALHGAAETLAQNAKSWSSDCIAQEEVEGKPQTDGRLKKIDTLLDPSRAAPAPIDPKPGGNDRFGYLGAARPYTGRQQRLTSSTLASTLSSYSPQTSTTASTADRTSMMSNKPAPPLVREVRRWQEGKAAVVLGSKDIAESKSKNRELVLLYVLTDEGTKDAPVSYRWVDRNSTTVEDDIAADEVVARGQRAAQDDVYLESRKRRGSCVGPSPTVTARSADAVTTTVEPSRFDDVLTSLLHGNMVVPHQEHGGMSPAQHRRASRTSAVISDVSAATREGAAVAASVFGVLMRGR